MDDDYGLTVEVRYELSDVLVTVAGEMDIATAPQLHDCLAALSASGRPLIVDLDRVTFIDAAGLRVLASAARLAAAHGASLTVVCMRYQVRRLFVITGLDRRIPLAPTITVARQNLTTAQDTPVSHDRQHIPPHRSGSS